MCVRSLCWYIIWMWTYWNYCSTGSSLFAGFFTAWCYTVCSIATANLLSICLSVMLIYRGWNTSNLISCLISVGFLLSADPSSTDLWQREHPEILAEITRFVVLFLFIVSHSHLLLCSECNKSWRSHWVYVASRGFVATARLSCSTLFVMQNVHHTHIVRYTIDKCDITDPTVIKTMKDGTHIG